MLTDDTNHHTCNKLHGNLTRFGSLLLHNHSGTFQQNYDGKIGRLQSQHYCNFEQYDRYVRTYSSVQFLLQPPESFLHLDSRLEYDQLNADKSDEILRQLQMQGKIHYTSAAGVALFRQNSFGLRAIIRLMAGLFAVIA